MMSKLAQIICELHNVENLAERNTWLCRLHPLAKVLVTIWYLVLTMGFGKYDLTGLAGMGIYPLTVMILGDISVGQAFCRLRPVLLMVFLIGLPNPFFDRAPALVAEGLTLSAGMISMMTLFCKAGFAVFASYILAATTTVEQICHAFRKLHMPQMFVTVILLIYRYLILMLREAERITQAYMLRAPGEKGIKKSAWGSLTGQMLLRSMDRAQTVYESMTLRGFRGEFFPRKDFVPAWQSVLYGVLWGIALAVFRCIPVFGIVGSLFL